MSIFVSSAIAYCNSNCHIGHVYEVILCDFIKRQFELLDHDVKLMTGTDEHGKKIQSTAEKNNMKPKEFCDEMVKHFVDMNKKYDINYDHFIRTTDDYHIDLVQNCIKKAFENNDIYKGEYKGYYSIREETFVPEESAKLTDYKDPVTGIPYDYISEESYFFKMAKYLPKIKEVINSIHPLKYQQEVSERLEQIGELKDLSISRTSFDWGIKFPNDEKKQERHITYVWFDALFCYMSSLKKLYGNTSKPDKIIHIIGKDIVWFHSVIYPAMLNSCFNDFYPYKILTHGFITDKEGRKMSKSLGNVISPDDLNKYPVEAIRFYVLTETNIGDDLNFSIERMMDKYNFVLIDEFGNLVQRIGNLVSDCLDEINKMSYYCSYEFTDIIDAINNFDLMKYYNLVFNKIKELNVFLNQEKPWDKEIDKNKKVIILKKCLHRLNIITKLLYPYIPKKIIEIRKLFGFSDSLSLNDNTLNELNMSFKKKQIIFEMVDRKEKNKKK